MSNAYLKNAFRMLDALNEDIFDVSDEGISQLADTLNTEDNTVNIIDPEAESEEDLQDSYMDKVILECEVCHSLIYKNKDEIKIDDESQLANIDEECPYCFSTNGYKIVGQVAPFKEESDKEDIDVEVDGEDVDIESEEDDEDEDIDESLKEGFNDVQISTDDQHLTMTQDSETGKVVVETEPIQKEESLEDDEMMIAPLNDEEEQEIEDNSDQLEAEEEGEEESEEVLEDETSEEPEDEESEEVDDNIESFNTSNVYQDNKNNKLIIEGVIKFNSGNSKKTSFIFEAKDIDKDRKVRLVGENQQITKGKKSFTLRGTLKDGTLLSESLTYNYRTRDNDGESIRLYNTIKVDK